MRIVYLSQSLIPSRTANSVHVMKMCQAFAKNGHEVVLLVPRNPHGEQGVADPFAYYDVERCFTLERTPTLGLVGRRFGYALMAGLKARRLRPDLGYGRSLLSCLLTARLGIPTVFEAHKLPGSRKSRRHFTRLIRCRAFRRLVVITQALKDDFLERFSLAPEQIVVAHDGADLSRTLQASSGATKDRLQVGYVGHLYPGKGMEIIAKLARACPWAHFHVVGGKSATSIIGSVN